jgi:hypothetical protein
VAEANKSNSSAQSVKEIPTWNCQLSPKDQVTVGQKLNLSCQGFDEVETDKRYTLTNEKKDPYFLHLLQVKKDNPMTKEFVVTPYRVYEGSLVLFLTDKQSGESVFQAAVNDIKVNSVIENQADAQMATPQGPSWILFSPFEFAILVFFIVSFLGYSIFRAIKRQKRKRDFKETMKLINYEDPFLDLTVDILSIEKNHKKIQNIKPHINRALKKFFYHFFDKPVFFDTPKDFDYELKKLKILDHDLRAIGVIKSDYNKILDGVEFSVEAKRDFLKSTKKNLNRLKRYEQQGSRA